METCPVLVWKQVRRDPQPSRMDRPERDPRGEEEAEMDQATMGMGEQGIEAGVSRRTLLTLLGGAAVALSVTTLGGPMASEVDAKKKKGKKRKKGQPNRSTSHAGGAAAPANLKPPTDMPVLPAMPPELEALLEGL
jgi:hypothetical protein